MTPTDEKKAAVTSGGKSKTNNSSYRAAAAAAIQQAVAQCVGGGLSIIPIDHHTKRPAMALLPRGADGKATWSRFGESPADIDMLMSWLNAKPLAIAVVCGRVSDGLLVMDFDVQRFYELWKSNVGGTGRWPARAANGRRRLSGLPPLRESRRQHQTSVGRR